MKQELIKLFICTLIALGLCLLFPYQPITVSAYDHNDLFKEIAMESKNCEWLGGERVEEYTALLFQRCSDDFGSRKYEAYKTIKVDVMKLKWERKVGLLELNEFE